MSSPAVWSAGRYEALAEMIAPIAVALVEAANARIPLRDAALVDLACGTGSAAIAAGARGARVTAADITPALIAIAEQKAAAAGHSISWLLADASATGLEAGSYDAVVSNMGIIFVEPTAQVAEIQRLLKPGGTLAFSAWVPDPGNPFFRPIVDVIGSRPDTGFSPDQWGRSETILGRLADGFTDVTIEQRSHVWQFASVDAAVDFVTRVSPTHVSLLAGVDADKREPLLAAYEAAMHAHYDGRRVQYSSPYVVVTARRR